ncbi:hypothetical protein [uncultured Enterovirga sp.]
MDEFLLHDVKFAWCEKLDGSIQADVPARESIGSSVRCAADPGFPEL